MQAVGQRLGVRIVCLVKLHGVPAVATPVLPVLYQHTDGQTLTAETVGGLQDLFRRVETLAAVDIAQRPGRHQRTRPRQVAVGGDDLIGRTDEHRVVDGFSHGGTEHGLVCYLVVVEYGTVVFGQFGRETMLSGLQMDDG